MKLLSLIALLILSWAGCTDFDGEKGEANIAPFEFDSYGLRIITTLASNKKNTISILYGNDLAFHASLNPTGSHVSGEKFVLVTWKQVPNKFWYGSMINGPLKTVETVTYSDSPVTPVLTTSYGQQDLTEINDDKDRIKFITSLRASVFP